MNDALELLYYIFGKGASFAFNSYLFPGVSIGMLLIGAFDFTLMLQNMLKVPNVGKDDKKDDKSNK